MTDTTKQIDRQALLVLAADAGFSVVGYSFVMPTHSGHITEEIEKFAELLAARATPVSPAQSDPVFVNQLQEAIFAARSIDGREDYWNDVLARLGVTAPAKPHSDLHSAIMNLPCNAGRAIAMNGASMQAYKEGHRDARHAAAELVAAHFATTPSEGVAAPVAVAPVVQEWQGDDGEALIHLAPNFTDTAGLLQPKAGYAPTAQDFAAINYLCNEWDYGYDPAPAAAPQGVNCDTPIGYRRDTTDPAEAANRMIAEVAAQGVEAPIPTSEVFAYAARQVEDELRQAREIMGVEAQKGGAA